MLLTLSDESTCVCSNKHVVSLVAIVCFVSTASASSLNAHKNVRARAATAGSLRMGHSKVELPNSATSSYHLKDEHMSIVARPGKLAPLQPRQNDLNMPRSLAQSGVQMSEGQVESWILGASCLSYTPDPLQISVDG